MNYSIHLKIACANRLKQSKRVALLRCQRGIVFEQWRNHLVNRPDLWRGSSFKRTSSTNKKTERSTILPVYQSREAPANFGGWWGKTDLSPIPKVNFIRLCFKNLDNIHWEMLDVLKEESVTRMPSLHFAYFLFKVHQKDMENGYKVSIFADSLEREKTWRTFAFR